jgi:hypothetical protein
MKIENKKYKIFFYFFVVIVYKENNSTFNTIMKRIDKSSDGLYHVGGKAYKHLIGSRKQVWMGSAYKTDGQLVKSDFIMNKHRRIVSAKKHASAKRDNRLVKAGYGTQKGKFGFVRLDGSRSKSRKSRGSRRK